MAKHKTRISSEFLVPPTDELHRPLDNPTIGTQNIDPVEQYIQASHIRIKQLEHNITSVINALQSLQEQMHDMQRELHRLESLAEIKDRVKQTEDEVRQTMTLLHQLKYDLSIEMHAMQIKVQESTNIVQSDLANQKGKMHWVYYVITAVAGALITYLISLIGKK